ncbi:MAG: hypothetical protein LUG15_05975 [Oscillospiraceae bacterium]|nr:hypothetical protein [Oscillospiraceae bacterium]
MITKNLKRGIAVLCSAALMSAMAISVSAAEEAESDAPHGTVAVARIVDIADDEVTLELTGGRGMQHGNIGFGSDEDEPHMEPPADMDAADGMALPERAEKPDADAEPPDDATLPREVGGMAPAGRGKNRGAPLNDADGMEKAAPRQTDGDETPPELPEGGAADESMTPPENPDGTPPEDLPGTPDEEGVAAVSITVDIDFFADTEISVGDVVKLIYGDTETLVSVEVLNSELPDA